MQSSYGQQTSQTWDLTKSRNAFLGRNGSMPDRNFWWYLLNRGAKEESNVQVRNQIEEMLADPTNLPVWEWKPNQANCPLLDSEIQALIEASREDWQPLMRSVFVGRTYDGDLNAEAKQRHGKAWIAVSFQYSVAVGAYVAAYDRLMEKLSRQVDLTPSDISKVFEQIGLFREGWANKQRFAGAHPFLMSGPVEREEEFYEPHATAAEMFVVSHEFGHHLLGHTNKRSLALGTVEDFSALLKDSSMTDFVFRRPEPQTKELLADLVGLSLLSLPRRLDPTRSAYVAMVGAITALVTEADVHHHWFLKDQDGHPPTTDRVSLMLGVFPHMFKESSIGAHDSVAGLTAQLAAFASACMQQSLSTREPKEYAPPRNEQIRRALKESRLILAKNKHSSPKEIGSS